MICSLSVEDEFYDLENYRNYETVAYTQSIFNMF